MKRILALDGGGIRGVFTLEVLQRMETLLREQYKQQDPARGENFVLRDHFDFFAGTSTGAIIATCLCWGMTVEQVLDMYVQHGSKMFQPVPWYRPIKKYLFARLDARPLTERLMGLFPEADGSPALLGSQLLLRRAGETSNKYLLIVVRNHTTGSAWPISNNPDAIYASRERDDCNLNIPLWKLVRASAAAPVYFPAEPILLGTRLQTFVDGSITPYSNPALIAALTALLPGYNMGWTPGPENVRIVSVGTLQFSSELRGKSARLWLGDHASRIPAALLQGTAWQQDYLCRCLGTCLFGEPLDSEIGDLIGHALPGRDWFTYVRYNRSYKASEMEDVLREHPRLARIDAVDAIPILRIIGKAYAEQNVRLEHLI